MSGFKIQRIVWRIIGILSSVTALVSIINDWGIAIIISISVMIADLIIIAIKNRCPFCHHSLRIAPISGEEFCSHCGCKIE